MFVEKAFEVLPWVQRETPPLPDSAAPLAETAVGLGLGLTLLTGIIIVMAGFAFAVLVLAWLRRDGEPRHTRKSSSVRPSEVANPAGS
jgi:hypothetical protein